MAWHQGGEQERPWGINGQLGRDIGVIRALATAAAIASTRNCSQAGVGNQLADPDTELIQTSGQYSLTSAFRECSMSPEQENLSKRTIDCQEEVNAPNPIKKQN